jgi:uncharacterized protein YjiS (DUF1127 family)
MPTLEPCSTRHEENSFVFRQAGSQTFSMPAETHPLRETNDHRASRSCATVLVTLVERWADRAAKRRILAGMSDAQLKDIGVSRADADAESRKPFWQL